MITLFAFIFCISICHDGIWQIFIESPKENPGPSTPPLLVIMICNIIFDIYYQFLHEFVIVLIPQIYAAK